MGTVMLPLYLLAAHLIGDFVLQTRWQSTNKWGPHPLGWNPYRFRHVLTYMAVFAPLAFTYADLARGALFLVLLGAWHYATDNQRFYSTLGDVIAWRLRSPLERKQEWVSTPHELRLVSPMVRNYADELRRTPANPWTTIPLVLDQTFHIVQIAVFAGWLLS